MSPMKHELIHETCSQCALCIAVCPAAIIGKNGMGETIFLDNKVEICVACGHCMAVCETKSIHIEGLSYEVNFPELPARSLDYDFFMDFLKTRRSVRVFRDKPVPEEMLQQIVDCIATAPFGVNKDNVHITVVSGKEIIQKALPDIAKMYRQIGMMLGNPFGRLLLKWMTSKQDYSTMTGFIAPHIKMGAYITPEEVDDISRNAQAMLIFHAPKDAGEHTVDSHIYTTYAILAAHALGLGATIIGLIGPAINQDKKLRTYFGIPKENEVVETVILGFPKIQFKRGIVRPRSKVTFVQNAL
jgi:nitroreductase/NAD-dependent dihydropyrimidine dehydrogenase PreA subunit